MKEKLLQLGLENEVEQWAAKTISELRASLSKPQCYLSKVENQEYQAEIQLLEDRLEYLHVGIGVDDLTVRSSMKPLSTSFLSYADGRVEQ